jgi:transcriptional regulator with XRE-family HTH domain
LKVEGEEAMDLVLKLREIRRLRGLSQKDVARISGVGEKTISSFETGQRIGSLKLAQLKRLLGVYGLTEAEFFGGSVEREIAPWELDQDDYAAQRLVDDLRSLPKHVQRAMIGKFRVMVETASDFNGLGARRPAYLREDSRERDWKMLNSNN